MFKRNKIVNVYTTTVNCERLFSLRKTDNNWIAGFWSIQEHNGALWMSYTARTQNQPTIGWLEFNRPRDMEECADIVMPD